MKSKLLDKTNSVQNRKFIVKIFAITLLGLLVSLGILRFCVYCDNNRPFRLELRNESVDELDHSLVVYMNSSQNWTSVERGENYEIGAQYDGIIENHTGKDIKEWKLSIYIPREGELDSYWNGDFEIAEDKIEIVPMEYNKEIKNEGDQTFGFIMYSGEVLSFTHFVITGYYNAEITNYPMFTILMILFGVWVFALIIYIWVYYRIRKLELQAEKDRQIISQAMETFAHLVDAKDQYTQEHSIRVALYAEEIAKRMGKSQEEATLIKYIALVHDCGKIGVPDAVLNKNGALNGGEREIVNSHTVLGGNVLHYFTAIDGIRDGALYHHERYDGSGYPEGLAGKKIPLCARIICIADAYDAMSSDRCYRKHLPKEKILEELMVNSGKQFDPDIVRYMISMVEDGFTYNIHHYDENNNEINNLEDIKLSQIKSEILYTKNDILLLSKTDTMQVPERGWIMKRYRFYMLTMVMVFIMFTFVTMKVNGQGEVDFAAQREYYDELEDDYQQRLQDMLENKGYRNAGITMTKIYRTDGSREYTVCIHHKRIDALDEGEKILLLNELAAISFGNEESTVLHKFLSYEG